MTREHGPTGADEHGQRDGGGRGKEEAWWLADGLHGRVKWSCLTPLEMDGMIWRSKKFSMIILVETQLF
jgi:hypothetical protein